MRTAPAIRAQAGTRCGISREGTASSIGRFTAAAKTIADGLNERLGVRPEDVLINLVEVKKENWSFGNGIAQYAG